MSDKKVVTPYQMAVNNTARHIRNSPEDGANPDIWQCSSVLAIAFCVSKEEVFAAIVKAEV